MTEFDALSEGWTVWNETDERCVLVYRPDVFDTQKFPAPCLPTLYLTHGRRSRRPGSKRDPNDGDPWYVTLFFEPEVERNPEQFETREEAIAGTLTIAERFANGNIDYRGLYQVPREEYFEELDELTGRA